MTTAPLVVEVDEGHRIQLPPGVDPEKALVTSSTQFDTHEMCERKWWFRWPMGMPEPPRDFLDFGKALHAVCERYLLADDLGRDERGLPVDLYPRGWDEGLSKAEADLIQRLVDKGKEAGLLVRGKDRLIEHPFLRPLLTHRDIEVFVCGYIDLALLADAEVQDHKTTKSLKWAKSPKALAETTQMRLYGREVLTLRDERGLPPRDVVSVRHNVYVKNAEDPAVKIVRATITREQIEERWAELQRRAQRMVEVKQRFRRPEDWHRLPNPTNVHKACLAFGGCPYQTICGGRESPQEYRRRVERLCDESLKRNEAKKTERNDMGNTFTSALAAIKGKNGKVGGKAPPINGTADVDESTEPADDATFWISVGGKTTGLTGEQIREHLAAGTLSLGTSAMPKGTGAKTWQTLGDLGFVDPTPTEEEAPPPPDEEEAPPAPDAEDEPPPAPDAPEPEEMSGNVSDALSTIAKAGKGKKKGSKAKPVIDGPAPWAFPGCIACQATPGFNSHGNPCRVCDDMQAKAGGTTSADFDVTTDGSGRVTWTPKAGGASASAPLPNGGKAVTAKAPSAPPKAEEPPAAPAAPARPVTVATPETTEALLKKGPGRPKTTFRLYINCLPVGADVVDLTEILKVYGAKLAEASKVESFYALDVFARRDALGSLAETIAGEVEGKRVMAQIPTGASDLRSLTDALRAYASEVVVGAVL